MKTILLTLALFLTGVDLWSQGLPPANTNFDVGALRRRIRERFGTNSVPTNGPASGGAVSPAVSSEGPTAPIVVSTNMAPGDAFTQAAASAAARTNNGRVFAMPPLKGTNVANGPVAAQSKTNAPTGPLGTVPAATNAPAPGANVVTGPNGATPGAQPPVVGAMAPGPDGTAGAGGVPEPIIPAGQIDFPATDVNQVLEIYAELVGKTLLRPTTLPAQLITLKTITPLTRTEAIQAFDSVLALNSIVTVPFGDKFIKVLPIAQGGGAGGKFNTTKERDLPEADEFLTQIVQLNYARPSEIIQALTPFAQVPGGILALDNNQMLIIRDYAANVKRMLELIKAIDVTVPQDFDSEVIPIKYALASDISAALSSLGGGTGTSVGRGSGSGAAGGRAGGATGGFGNTGLGGGVGGGPGGFGSGTLGTAGQPGYQQPGALGGAAGGGARTTTFADRLGSLVRRAASAGEFQVLGQTKIIADERTNSLLVFADKQDMKMIKDIIQKLDVVLAQVLIEAIIMEVNLSSGNSLGVSYLQKNPSTPGNYFQGTGAIQNTGNFLTPGAFAAGTNGAGALSSGLSYFGRFGGDFEATILAAANDDRVNILSRPRIQTSHAVTASLQIGETIPYVTGTYFGGINGAASSQYQQTFVGINLQVTPLINPDGLVVMDIVQDIQDLDGTTQIDSNAVPNTSKRTAQAKVSVRDRDTIILGGFISSHKEKKKSGVPFLMDIPLLGMLFNSSSSTSARTELIVLIRPTVLPTPESAALVATTERNKSGAIKGAEAEYRADDLRSQKEANKIKIPKDQ